MNTIVFKNVVPNVFADNASLQSGIWNREVEFVKGRTYLVEAESGKGKSTFCSYILGYRNDYAGHIMFDDTDVRRLSIARWTDVRKHNISYVFQELRLFPELTAFENIEIKNRLTGFRSKNEIEQWFDRLGIADKRDVKVRFMSFGQQQRVAMIRALVQPFDFILADEPISHLDDNNSQTMGEIMIEEAERQGAGVIVTSIGKHINISYDHVIML
ncbi:MAG: ATP-binding cassette domain-containing protein [Prevotella sp.]|uniref:ATP-binding cassette domain-containing protein n=1 Tax=Prevotella sp. TaxID=59823 RepID=UPI002A28B14C|nr:ATP-binding cassette domain-containing protein [Prevotella sp.]MDD7318273.1 ATP-binding cassette domain-containing protein [Prevotellaceae bacterium]MDY4019723.1 ATP-binding cassette domain-containing protein [Prevotella sp.]